jgi:hypothetical protein
VHFYIGPEFVEILQSLTADRPVEDPSVAVSERPHTCKSKDHPTPLQHVALRPGSFVTAVVTVEWILLLICAWMLFC